MDHEAPHVAGDPFIAHCLGWARAVCDRARTPNDDEATARVVAARDSLLGAMDEAEATGPAVTCAALTRHLAPLDRDIVLMLVAALLDPWLIGERDGRTSDDSSMTVFALTLLLAGPAPEVRLAVAQRLARDAPLARARLIEPIEVAHQGLQARVRLTRAAARRLLALPIDAVALRVQPSATLARSGPRRAVFAPGHRDRLREALLAFGRAHHQQKTDVTRGFDAHLALFWGPSGVGKARAALDLLAELFESTIVVDGRGLATSADPGGYLRDAFDLAVIDRAALLIDGIAAVANLPALSALFVFLARRVPTIVICTADERMVTSPLEDHWHFVARFDDVSRDHATELWQAHLPEDIVDAGALSALSERYALSGQAIARAAGLALAQRGRGEALDAEQLREAAEAQLDSDFGGMVQRVRPRHRLDDLVLPEHELATVTEIIAAARNWHHVMGTWGLGARLATGKCISCLFSGEPGTGKTFAAEIIAGALDEVLHVVSLPSIMSKWMGESERNLRHLFAVARTSGAVLLFDEADALFTQRVEVNSSQDSFRNMLTGLLLQELDRHTGVVILTTNLAQNIDQAFQRRIMFQIEFPSPDEPSRARIWQGLIPASLPCGDDLDLEDLAEHFELSGGEIKNSVMRAALRAWQDGDVLTQRHAEEACQAEYRNTGRLVMRRLGDDY